MGGRSSVVEFQPSKLAVVGSNPIARSNIKIGAGAISCNLKCMKMFEEGLDFTDGA